MKSHSPLLGFNNNVRHKGRVFHIQTEDSGLRHPHVITHLFADGGRILKTTKTSYAEHVGEANISETVRAMMKEQHKAMFIALRDGQLDHLLEDIPSAQATAAKTAAKAEAEAKAATSAAQGAATAAAPEGAAAKADQATPRAEPVNVEANRAIPATADAGPVAFARTQPPPPPPPPSSPTAKAPPLPTAARAGARPADARLDVDVAAVSPTAVTEPAPASRPSSMPRRTPSRPRLQIEPGLLHRPVSPHAPTLEMQTSRESSIDLDLDALERAAVEAQNPVFTRQNDLPPPPAAMLNKKPGARPGGYSVTATTPTHGTPRAPPAPQPQPLPPSAGRYAPSRPAAIFAATRPQEGASIFGEDLISEKSLDEVILSYLAEDLDGPAEKK